MINDVLKQLTLKQNLLKNTMTFVMKEITEGRATEAQIAAFLTALKMKCETVEEITAAAEVMRSKCVKTELGTYNTLDIVGTGGDMTGTFNISTASAFVAAAGGVPVAKHGNRALTSKAGSADVLEALGININKTPEEEKNIFKKINICFMYATNHHLCMKYASKVRKELGFRTLFNILGPLTNPACARSQLLGVYDEKLVEPIAKVISNLGVDNAIVLHGTDGMDEATITSETIISELKNKIIKSYVISPSDFGIKKCIIEDIQGGNANDNALIIKNIFSGKEKGAKKDIVVLNSALAFYVYGKVQTIKEGVVFAENVIESGLAFDKLNKYIEISNEV